MGLFEFTAGKVIITKELQQLAPFKKLMKGKDWEDKIAYVFHMADYSSPYAKLSDEEKAQKLSDMLLNGKAPSKELKEAVELYRELSTTDSLLLLQSARQAVSKLRRYFEDVNFEHEEEPGKAAKDLMSNLNNVGKIIESIKNWEETITKEKKSEQTRKGVKQTKYNT